MATNTTTARNKIKDINELALLLESVRANGKVVVLCHGVFDLLHIGHIRHLIAARDRCNMLFVSITSDNFINKGPDRPLIPDIERAEVVSNLKPVSGALINHYPTAVELLKLIQPSIYFKGQEYLHGQEKGFTEEKATAIGLGIRVDHTHEKVCSSSKIISKLKNPSP